MSEIHPFHDKVILVTGGSQGIGQAVCRFLREKGALVIDASVDNPRLPGDGDLHGEVYRVWVDVADPQSVQALFTWIDQTFHRIDILVNSAGVFIFKPIAEISYDEWQRSMKINLDGAFLCIREALRRMLPAKQGQIINMGSIAGQTPLPNNGAYGTSKAALRMLTQIIQEEYAGQGITASLLTLGAVSTGLWDDFPEQQTRQMLTPDRVAAAVGHIIEQNTVGRLEEVCLLPAFRFLDNLE